MTGNAAREWLDALRTEAPRLGRSSTAERVADVLRQHVTQGRLTPGTRLSEEDLGAALGVSRNTLREAFRLLTHEGLLVHEFNRGVFVRALSAEDVRDLYRVRRILEVAALHGPPGPDTRPAGDRLAPVRDAVLEGERAAAEERWVDVGTANMRFHQALAGLAGSPRVDDLMRQLLAELRLVFHAMAAPREFHLPYLAVNREILEHLEAGDPAAAGSTLTAYFDAAEAQLLAVFAQKG